MKFACKSRFASVWLAITLALGGTGSASAQAAAAVAPLEVRVVVVTTFEVGADAGDVAGELQDWVERYPLAETIAFPQTSWSPSRPQGEGGRSPST